MRRHLLSVPRWPCCARDRKRTPRPFSGGRRCWLPEKGLGKLCGLSEQELDEWRLEGRVLGIAGSAQRFRYPAWQIGPDGQIFPAVAQVLAAFGGPMSFAAYRFLVTPLDLLGGRAPYELLGGAEEAEVAQIAEAAARGDFL